MTQKGSQISIYILVGFLVLMIIAFFVLQLNRPDKDIGQQASEQQEVSRKASSYVTGCMISSSEKALYNLGERGGFYNIFHHPANSGTEVALYYSKSVSYMPSIDTLQENFAMYVREDIKDCLFMLGDYSEIIGEEDIPIDVSVILSDKIYVNLKYPIKLVTKNGYIDFPEQKISIDFNFQNVYEAVGRIIDEQLIFQDMIVIGKITELSETYGYTFKINHLDSQKIILSMDFPKKTGEDYTFAFMMDYSWYNEPEVEI